VSRNCPGRPGPPPRLDLARSSPRQEAESFSRESDPSEISNFQPPAGARCGIVCGMLDSAGVKLRRTQRRSLGWPSGWRVGDRLGHGAPSNRITVQSVAICGDLWRIVADSHEPRRVTSHEESRVTKGGEGECWRISGESRSVGVARALGLGKRVYVGNLPFSSTEEDLPEASGRHGEVLSVDVIGDRDTGRPRGFAFVEMGDSSAAGAAIAALDGNDSDGRNLRVTEAQKRGGGGRR